MGFDDLRARILTRYPSVHAFCRAHPELSRSTVYLVLSGRYPGNAGAQAARIWDAMAVSPEPADPDAPPLSGDEMAEALQGIRCGNCRRLDRRACLECRTQTTREARALHEYIFCRHILVGEGHE